MNTSSFKGFTLVEVLVSIGMLSVVMMLSLTTIEMISKEKQKAVAQQTFFNIKEQLTEQLNGYNSWLKTLSHTDNSAMGCARTGSITPCNHEASGTFKIFDSDNIEFFNPSEQGFLISGDRCTLSGGEPTAECPISVALSWKALCAAPATTCTPAVLKLNLDFSFHSSLNESLSSSLANTNLQLHKFPEDQANNLGLVSISQVLSIASNKNLAANLNLMYWNDITFNPDPDGNKCDSNPKFITSIKITSDQKLVVAQGDEPGKVICSLDSFGGCSFSLDQVPGMGGICVIQPTGPGVSHTGMRFQISKDGVSTSMIRLNYSTTLMVYSQFTHAIGAGINSTIFYSPWIEL
ncbi:MAG TPA: prepilin-type N-terminal cleavage/methylation domain-containing protein [Pseudobdellovibrionaceae bacterium]|nr:prepilin-type N-terminal cleavage/methylation domain-containing protein [Pseudobdellovibrionaceae bacterium]